MNRDKTALEKLIYFVENNYLPSAESVRGGAEDDLKWLKSSIYMPDKKELQVYDDLIKHVKNQDNGHVTKNLTKRARSHFEEHVRPLLQNRHAHSTQPNTSPPVKNTDSNTFQDRQRNPDNNEQKQGGKGKQGNDSGQKAQAGHNSISVTKTTQHGLDRGHHSNWRQYTPENFATGFMRMYDEDWLEANFRAKKHLKDEKTTTAFLLKIVQVAYKECRREAEDQIEQMKNCALQIVMGKVSRAKAGIAYTATSLVLKCDFDKINTELPKPPPKADVSLLTQYRKDHADVSLDRIKHNFASSLRDIYKSFNVQREDAIDVYAFLCVEITWWMNVQDPPIYMICDDKREEFDDKIYAPIIKSGKRVNYIVWPPLLQYEDGPVLQKGLAIGQ